MIEIGQLSCFLWIWKSQIFANIGERAFGQNETKPHWLKIKEINFSKLLTSRECYHKQNFLHDTNYRWNPQRKGE